MYILQENNTHFYIKHAKKTISSQVQDTGVKTQKIIGAVNQT
jgi:hypothetical protein